MRDRRKCRGETDGKYRQNGRQRKLKGEKGMVRREKGEESERREKREGGRE